MSKTTHLESIELASLATVSGGFSASAAAVSAACISNERHLGRGILNSLSSGMVKPATVGGNSRPLPLLGDILK